MMFSNIYKNYFPVKGYLDLYKFNNKEIQQLSNWINQIQIEVQQWNIKQMIKSIRCGINCAVQFKLEYKKDIKEIIDLIKNRQYNQLDQVDIKFINTVIYRHKYNTFLSMFLFPIYCQDND